MGRIKQERRTIGSVAGKYDTDTINLDGSVGNATYENGYGVSYTYTRAQRQKTLTSFNTPETTYVTATSYAPSGGVTSSTWGAGTTAVTITDSYNSRLQPVTLSAATPAATIMSLTYDFHLGSGDNGNVFKITNNRDGNRTQNFSYDSLNRISQAYTNGANWGETFGPTATAPGTAPTTSGIDAWGNLINRSGVTGKGLYEPLSTSATLKNQLTGYGYDAAGNMISNGSANYVYDAENRIIATAGTSYIYDGDGQRVEKCTQGATAGSCATNATGTLYWRGWGDEINTETDLAGNATENYIFFNGQRIARRDVSTGAVHYYFSDHLGTHSLVTDINGTMPPQEESDFYPYGGEIPVSGSDPNHYKFTGKERDTESGLDEFGARYYSSSMGRFMIPDWAAKSITVPYADFGNPQSLNLYDYVGNNPLTFIDDDGHDIIYAPGLQNAQLVKDTVQAILANPHTGANLSGYVGKDNPDLIIKSGDLSKEDSSTNNPDGTPGASITKGGTDASGLQTATSSSTDINGVTTTGAPEISGSTTITIDNRTSKGDTPGVLVHESVHAGEARANPTQYSKDAVAEKAANPSCHDCRPQEQRANAAQKAFTDEIKKEVKQTQKARKKDSKHQ